MTIAATPRRSPVYTGNGVATTYAFSFKVLDATTLVVTVADENDLNSAVLVNGVDYTVTLNPDQDASPGGEIGYAGLPVGHRLVITSATDASQPTAIANLGAFHADVIEAALDRSGSQHQQQQEQLDRCVKVAATSEQDPTTLLDNAVTSASNSANAAAASASAAQTARTGAEAALDAFDDRYLGAKASDPTTDNDGNPLIDGALYWNTASNRMRIYTLATTSWGPFPATAADVAVTPAGNIASSDVQAALQELDGEKVAKAGDTMTGPLTTPMVVTDSPMSFRNKIINGAMAIDQRNGGGARAITTTGVYTLDRWAASNSTSGGFTVQRVSDAPPGFVSSLKVTITTADASLTAGEFSQVYQQVEGANVADLSWGTATAKSITLSFWVKSSLTGTFSGAVTNGANNRSYAFTFSISAAATWEYKTITIPGDTTGTWANDSTVGLSLRFTIGTGSTFLGAAGAWAAANYLGATGSVQLINTLSATLQFTGVQLESGSVATPFEQRPYGLELQLCRRYYEQSLVSAATPGESANYECGMWPLAAGGSFPVRYKVPKRAGPTLVQTFAPTTGNGGQGASGRVRDDSAGTDVNVTGVYGTGINGHIFITAAPASAGSRCLYHWTADAEL